MDEECSIIIYHIFIICLSGDGHHQWLCLLPDVKTVTEPMDVEASVFGVERAIIG